MRHQIAQASNTVVPALLAIESLGFTVEVGDQFVTARGRNGEFIAEDPVAVLGLIRLVDLRSWAWSADDEQIDAVLKRHKIA